VHASHAALNRPTALRGSRSYLRVGERELEAGGRVAPRQVLNRAVGCETLVAQCCSVVLPVLLAAATGGRRPPTQAGRSRGAQGAGISAIVVPSCQTSGTGYMRTSATSTPCTRALVQMTRKNGPGGRARSTRTRVDGTRSEELASCLRIEERELGGRTDLARR
jgi:hypothetical protein